MNEWVKQVTKFQMKFENPMDNYKSTKQLVEHRLKLIEEEFNEYKKASQDFAKATDEIRSKYEDNKDADEESEEVKEMIRALTEMLDAIADMTVINIGTANLLGMDLDEAMRRVYESNMSKLGADGKPIYDEEGKVKKGPNYHKPKDLSQCIDGLRADEFAIKCKMAKLVPSCHKKNKTMHIFFLEA